MEITITAASSSAFKPALPFVKKIINSGETYALPRDMCDAEIQDYFFRKDSQVFLASMNDEIMGVYYLRPNQSGGGSHVANAGFMVCEKARGKGIARAMAEHALKTAKAGGFEAMQFNFVVSNNVYAIKLWRCLGFEIMGTLPKAFNHPKDGKIDALVMYKLL